MKKIYGEIIPNLEINGKPAPYPVVNEREIRATAGIMFLIGISTFFIVIFTKTYLLMNIVVIAFWLEFLLKTIFAPKYSFFAIFARALVRKQTPEYVGAAQKRVAWTIGLTAATLMIILAGIFGIRGPLPITICLICLLFMWMESTLGVCFGCQVYALMLKKKLIPSPEVKPACPGNVCELD